MSLLWDPVLGILDGPVLEIPQPLVPEALLSHSVVLVGIQGPLQSLQSTISFDLHEQS